MANKHLKMCSVFLASQKIEIKVTIYYQHMFTTVAKDEQDQVLVWMLMHYKWQYNLDNHFGMLFDGIY